MTSGGELPPLTDAEIASITRAVDQNLMGEVPNWGKTRNVVLRLLATIAEQRDALQAIRGLAQADAEHAQALGEQIQSLEAGLRALEWTYHMTPQDDFELACPSCGNWQESGHELNCALAALLNPSRARS